jgi:hypothetical protein
MSEDSVALVHCQFLNDSYRRQIFDLAGECEMLKAKVARLEALLAIRRL